MFILTKYYMMYTVPKYYKYNFMNHFKNSFKND